MVSIGDYLELDVARNIADQGPEHNGEEEEFPVASSIAWVVVCFPQKRRG